MEMSSADSDSDNISSNNNNNNNIIPSEEGETTTTTITTTIDRKRKMEAKSTAAITSTINMNTTESTQQQRPRQGLVKPRPKFTVTYSRLCDGGTQEMSTAVGCVREIFPDASIQTTRRQPQEEIGMHNPPVVISVAEAVHLMGGTTEKGEFGKTTIKPVVAVAASSGSTATSNNSNSVLWSSKQKNLYQKYPKKRRRSMKDIRKTLEAFKLSRTAENKPQTVRATPTQPTTTPNEISSEFSTEQSEPSLELATATTATEKDESNIAAS